MQLPFKFGCIRLQCLDSSTWNRQRLPVEHAGGGPASCSSILRQLVAQTFSRFFVVVFLFLVVSIVVVVLRLVVCHWCWWWWCLVLGAGVGVGVGVVVVVVVVVVLVVVLG